MTSTLLVLLLSQADGPTTPPAGAMEPPLHVGVDHAR